MSEFLDTPELQDKVIVRLVDDDKDFLRSMKLMLEMMGWKVRDFSLAQDFLQEENFKVPGCIVLDMRMPGMTGLELQRQLINDKEKALPIIFLTAHADVNMVIGAFKGGAFDFLRKPVVPELLTQAIEKAVEENEQTLEKLRESAPEKRYEHLSEQQKQVAKLIARNLTSSVIGERLGKSRRTIERHRANVLHLLGVSTPSELKDFLMAINKF